MARTVHVKQFHSFSEASSFLWSIADLLRGIYKQHDFGKVILPFTVLRRLDCVLADTKDKVLARHAKLAGGKVKDPTPLMVNLLFMEDDKVLREKGVVKTLYDPACGTGGMLSVAKSYLYDLNPDAHLEVFGQELNDETLGTGAAR